ncbi:hypothetical protein IFM46972_07870 [Aspergillus udagawae]|uniref:Uncharacterized protein n=1 Tax=Aspergillus udagawae TaxID=91492 RepID=A0A8H3P9T4_9EURO|nr:hypothetical protein IFM46972_07870 [Aspergillus udagawae]
MSCLCTRRSDIIRRTLEASHVRPFQAGVFRRCGDRLVERRLASVFCFHRGKLRLLLQFCFISGCTVRIDGLFGKVVGSAASCRILNETLTDAKSSPADPVNMSMMN